MGNTKRPHGYRLLLILLMAAMTATAFSQPAADSTRYRNSIKTSFLSWHTGSVKLVYERAVAERRRLELTMAVIGLMSDSYNNNPKGIHAQAAYKFIAPGACPQPLNGFYVKPALAFSHFTYRNPKSPVRDESNVMAVMVIGGYQLARNRLALDLYWGIGGAFGTECDTFYEHGFLLWDFFGTRNSNVALTSGIKIGFCF